MSLDNAIGSGPVGDKLTVDDQEKVSNALFKDESGLFNSSCMHFAIKAISALSESVSDSSQLDGTVISSSGATYGEWMIKRLV